jgi:hypothetical protein
MHLAKEDPASQQIMCCKCCVYLQVIAAHSDCLTKILRFSLIERLRPLTAIGTINRSCSHFCDAVERVISVCNPARSSGTAHGSKGTGQGRPGAAQSEPLTQEHLIAMASNEEFSRAIDECNTSFNKVRQ